jgi:hypothetical protein
LRPFALFYIIAITYQKKETEKDLRSWMFDVFKKWLPKLEKVEFSPQI